MDVENNKHTEEKKQLEDAARLKEVAEREEKQKVEAAAAEEAVRNRILAQKNSAPRLTTSFSLFGV
jgi:hypothetical protein